MALCRPLSFALLLAGMLASQATAQTPHTVTGADGRTVEIRDPSRIVTIGSAVTEIVFALGHGNQVVAIDQTSTFPKAATAKPNVGYMRALSAEGVLSLSPTLIVAIEGSGPPDVIATLARASVPFVLVPDGHDQAAILKKIEMIARTLGEEERGREISQAVAQDFRAVEALRSKLIAQRRAVFVLTAGNGAPIVGGARTSADGILTLAGAENAMHQLSGFKPAVAESVLSAAPEVVVMLHERNHALDPKTLFALPAFAGTPAARGERVVSIPSYYLAFGPRTAHAALQLMQSIYPEQPRASLPDRPWTRADGK